MQIFDNDTLTKFIKKFYGYGNYRGAIWFVGMEPGASDDNNEIKKFFDVWKYRGELEIDDVKKSHLETGLEHYTKFFTEDCVIEKTWGALIEILLYANGKNVFTNNDIKIYQRTNLGKKDSKHCLIELLPLPSRNIKNWPYREVDVKAIVDKKLYELTYIPLRLEHIKNLIKEYTPKVVVFYSLTYKRHWEKLVDKEFLLYKEIFDKKIWRIEKDSTLYLIIAHPSARGKFGNYFSEVGNLVKKHLEK